MANLECPCGFLHDLDPQPDEAWMTFKDKEYDAMEKEILRIHSEHRPAEIQFTYGRIYECPECGRLMWARPGDSRYSVFTPEEIHNNSNKSD